MKANFSPFIAIIFLFNICQLSAQVDPILIGKWSGIASQSGFGTYPTMIVIDSMVVDQLAGKINYPDLPCSGNLTFEGNAGDIHIFRETITGGAGCTNLGRIEITKISTGTIQWDWFYNGGTVPNVSGVFARMIIDPGVIRSWCGEVFQGELFPLQNHPVVDGVDLPTGSYVLNVKGLHFQTSKKIIIQK